MMKLNALYYFNKIINLLFHTNRNAHKIIIEKTDFNYLNNKSHNNIFYFICNNNIDALIIDNLFSLNQLEGIKSGIQKIKSNHTDLVDKKDNGYTIGKTLFDTSEINDYKNLAKEYMDVQKRYLKIDLEKSLIELISKLSGEKQVQAAVFDDGKSYISHTIRVMQSNLGGLHPHSDLLIHKTFTESKHILSIIDPNTLISIFVLVQKPQYGGRLVLYESIYDTSENTTSEKKTDKHAAIRLFLKDKNRCFIDLKEGSAIIFNAGQRWHSIENINGIKDRITFGCFAAYTKQHDKIIIWS